MMFFFANVLELNTFLFIIEFNKGLIEFSIGTQARLGLLLQVGLPCCMTNICMYIFVYIYTAFLAQGIWHKL